MRRNHKNHIGSRAGLSLTSFYCSVINSLGPGSLNGKRVNNGAIAKEANRGRGSKTSDAALPQLPLVFSKCQWESKMLSKIHHPRQNVFFLKFDH